MADMVKSGDSSIAFFETEEWENERLSRGLEGRDLLFFPGPLDSSSLPQLSGVSVLSVFIRSAVGREVIDALPNLSFIATRSTGYDHVDLAACEERGIVVSNVPFYGENTVAEHTFGLILALSRKIHKAYMRTIQGNFSLDGLRGFDLQGRTLGVIGAGRIGLHVIRIAKGFGMKVLAFDVRRDELISGVLGFEYASLDELLGMSDIISLHAPMNEQNYHLIDREKLSKTKRGAILINTARGGLVDTGALIWALDEGILSGAGLDVVEGEELIEEEKRLLSTPATEDKLRMVLRQHVLLRREDVVVTPHIAFNSWEALARIVDTSAENIRRFLEGAPQNVINPQLLPVQKLGKAA